MGTLYYVQPGMIERSGVGKDALDKSIDVLRMRYNKIALQGQEFVRTEQAKGGVYTESTYGTELELPRQNQDSDQLPFATPTPGYKKSATVVNYRLAIRVERSYTEDDLKGVVRKQMSGLLDSGRLLTEYAIAAWINNLTSSSYLGADGVALASDSHPYYRRETGTWDNLETAAALSLTTFSTARTNLRKRGSSDFGYVMPIMVKKLVVPPDLEKTARDLKASTLNPGTSTNEPNTWKNDPWDVKVYDYMTDTNAWFLLGDMPDEYKGIVYAYTVQPNIAPLAGSDMSTDIIWGQRLRARFVVSGVDGLNLQLNVGA